MGFPAMKKFLVPFVALLLLAGLWFSLLLPERAPQAQLALLDGKILQLSDLKGKVVLVNFWATSCPSCVKEMPGMAATYQDYRDQGFETVAIAMSYDPPTHVLNFVQKNGLPFPVALDADGGAAQAFGNIMVTPTSFMLDQDGKIVKRILGEIQFPELHAELDKLLGTR